MKKLTKLQIMMLMSLSVGSIYLQGQDEQSFQEQAITLELKSEKAEDIDDKVLQALADVAPASVESLIFETEELTPSFGEIKKLVDKKNKEIERLSKQAEINQADIARIGIELADAQASLKKAEALQRAKHKKPNKLEQLINDSLKKAEQALKRLNDSATTKAVKRVAVESGKFISKKAEEAYETVSTKAKEIMSPEKDLSGQENSMKKKNKSSKKKSKASKAAIKASAEEPMLMDEDVMIDQAMDNAMLNE
jgi:hypothetical protein